MFYIVKRSSRLKSITSTVLRLIKCSLTISAGLAEVQQYMFIIHTMQAQDHTLHVINKSWRTSMLKSAINPATALLV